MTLSDHLSMSISMILSGVKEYSDYSKQYRDEIIEILTVSYYNLFKMDSKGMKAIKRDLEFCKKYATKEWNAHFYNLDDDDYSHCQGCFCEECVNRIHPFKYDCPNCTADDGWNCECYHCKIKT